MAALPITSINLIKQIDMKAMITFVSGQTMDVDIYYDGDKPVSIPQLERMYLTEFNRATPMELSWQRSKSSAQAA